MTSSFFCLGVVVDYPASQSDIRISSLKSWSCFSDECSINTVWSWAPKWEWETDARLKYLPKEEKRTLNLRYMDLLSLVLKMTGRHFRFCYCFSHTRFPLELDSEDHLNNINMWNHSHCLKKLGHFCDQVILHYYICICKWRYGYICSVNTCSLSLFKNLTSSLQHNC